MGFKGIREESTRRPANWPSAEMQEHQKRREEMGVSFPLLSTAIATFTRLKVYWKAISLK
jgi:hypothetical protein